MLSSIQKILGSFVPETWSAEMITLGNLVYLYRQYEDGEHRDGLTSKQRTQLGLNNHTLIAQFNMNYMPLIVGKMADRLHVVGIDVKTKQAVSEVNRPQVWLDGVRDWNRFDELQVGVHEAAIRDGHTFLMIEYDNEEKRTRWVHESAYDSNTKTGMMVVYDSTGTRIVAAVKIWNESYTSGAENKRVNIYRAGVIEKYITDGKGAIKPYTDDTTDEQGLVWNTSTGAENGDPLGIPIFHFANNRKRRRIFGQSELHNGIPLQDAINWALTDMMMTSRLSSFQLRYAKGFEPDVEAGPGDFIIFGDETDNAAILGAMEVGVIPQGEIMPFLDEIRQIRERLGEITRTPLPSTGGNNESGEALKERSIGLVEKVQRAQVTFGNVWEDVAKYSLKLHGYFGGVTLPDVTLNTRWMPAELRNDADIISAAQVMYDAGYEKEFLRLMGQLPYLGYDDTKITELVKEKMDQASQSASLFNLPGVGTRIA